MQISNRFTRYAPVMRRAILQARTSATVNKELYLLTDLQGTHFVSDSTTEQPQRVDGAAGPGCSSRGFPPQPPRQRRCGLRHGRQQDPRTEQTYHGPGGRSELRRTVHSRNGVASLYIEGTRVAQQSFSLAPRGSAPVELTGIPKRRGVLGCSVRIEDDILEIDNRRNFSIAIPETITVLLAGSTPASTRFAYLALSLAGDSSVAGLFHVRQIPEDRLMTADIEATDVLVLCSGTYRSRRCRCTDRKRSAERYGTYDLPGT